MVTFDNKGHLVMRTNEPCTPEHWNNMVTALNEAIQAMDDLSQRETTVFWLLDLQRQLMPTLRQMQAIQKSDILA